MKNAITLIKKTFVIISVNWTTITLVFINFMTFSDPSSCSVDNLEGKNVSEATGELSISFLFGEKEIPSFIKAYSSNFNKEFIER